MCFSLLYKDVKEKTTSESFLNVFAKLLNVQISFNKVSAYLHILNCKMRYFKQMCGGRKFNLSFQR